jgi:hypothetical protein
MSINAITGGTSTALYEASGPSPTGVQSGAPVTDPKALLEAGRLLNESSTTKATDLPTPPAVSASRAASTNEMLGGLSSTQVGADMYAVMALFQKISQEMRNASRTQRATELQTQVSTLESAAQKIREAASQRYNAAIAQGVFQIAGGLTQMGTSFGSLSAKTDNTAKVWHGAGQASSSILGGIGGIVSGSFNYQAGQDDADRAHLEAQAKIHESASQQANDQMQQMLEVIRDVRDKLQAIEQSAVETNRSIARNI